MLIVRRFLSMQDPNDIEKHLDLPPSWVLPISISSKGCYLYVSLLIFVTCTFFFKENLHCNADLPLLMAHVFHCVRQHESVLNFCINVIFAGSYILKKSYQYKIKYFQWNGENSIFLILDLDIHLQLWISHKWWQIWKCYIRRQVGTTVFFRLEYLHLTLAHSKGQGQGHPHLSCEYLVNGDR